MAKITKSSNLPKNQSVYLIFDSIWGNMAFWFDEKCEADYYLSKLNKIDRNKLSKPIKFCRDY